MQSTVRIGVIGDFNPEFPSHTATNAAIAHAAAAISASVDVDSPEFSLGPLLRQNRGSVAL